MVRMWMILSLLAINAPRLAAGEKLPWFEGKDRPNVALLPAAKGEAGPIVKVTGGPEKTTTLMVQLDPAKAPSYRYVLKGRVKFEAVQDVGYLEMLSTFAKNGRSLGRATGTISSCHSSASRDFCPRRSSSTWCCPGRGRCISRR
jgi:hypothetical protein